MTLNINLIEYKIYAKICDDFAEFAEKKLQRYKSVLEFLRVTDVEKIVSATTSEIYDHYVLFCKETEFEPLDHTVFSRTVCECGFITRAIVKTIQGKRKKLIYFYLR